MTTVPTMEELVRAREELAGRLADIETAVAAQLSRTQTDLDSGVAESFRAAVTAAAAGHRELAAQLARAEPGADDLVLVAESYRDGVATAVLAPLHEYLETARPGERVAEAFAEASSTIAALAGSPAESVTLPEADDLYLPQPGDQLPTAVGKALVRFRRGAGGGIQSASNTVRGLFSKAPLPAPVRTRNVPVGALLSYHIEARIARLVIAAHEDYQQRIGRLVAALEDAMADWTNGVLEVCRVVDRPAPHMTTAPAEAAEGTGTDDSGEESPVVATTEGELSAHAAWLQDDLDRLLQTPGPPEPKSDSLRDAFAALARDVVTAGTFMLPPADRRISRGAAPAAAMEKRAATWRGWHEQSCNRLALLDRVTRLQGEITGIESELLTGIAAATLNPVFDTFQQLREALQRCDEEASRIGSTGGESPAAIAGRYRKLGETTLGAIKGLLRDIPGIVASDRALTAPGAAQWRRLQELIETLPEGYLVHAGRDDDAADVIPDRAPFTIGLRAITRDALDPPLPEQLKQPAAPLRQKIPHVWGETEQIQNIVQYNFGAAAEEWESAGGSDQASELARDGIRRAIDTLAELAESLTEPWTALVRAVSDTFREDWADLHRRVRSEAVLEEKWVGIRTRIERDVESTWHRLRQWWQRRLQIGRRRALQARALILRLIQRGRSAVSTSGAGEQEAHEVLVSMSEVQAVRDGLPLVYRRLFSFGPLKEPALFTGRERELKRLQSHFSAWRAGGSSGVALIPGAPGSGRTSFLNVLSTRVLADTDVYTVTLAARISHESDLARLIAAAFEIDLPAGAGLRQLEDALARGRAKRRPSACLVDNLEHLLLRVPDGTDLFEQALLFFSRTDTSVYWIGSIAQEAWRFVEQSVPSAAACVTSYPLSGFDRDTLERAIVNRHERSGMPLVFAAPSEPSAVLSRRLRRAVGQKKQQAILREYYFDQVHRLSGPQATLALFYWIRSADFETKPDSLVVNAIDPIDFRFLNSLDLQQAFSLLAFVMHNTLTLEEHNAVLTLPEDVGRFTLESLVRLRLLTVQPGPGTTDPTNTADVSIGAGERYRIRRLALQPIIELLRKRNIAS